MRVKEDEQLIPISQPIGDGARTQMGEGSSGSFHCIPSVNCKARCSMAARVLSAHS